MGKIKIAVPVGKAKLVDEAVKSEAVANDAYIQQLREAHTKIQMLEDRIVNKTTEVTEAKKFISKLQEEHEKEKSVTSATIDKLRLEP